MNDILSLGYSPCPNDTFIFSAIAENRISVDPHRFEITLADVEVLNRKAREGRLDVSKVSINAVSQLLDDYWLLRAGGAIGRGCGPLVVSAKKVSIDELRKGTFAIPGRFTTANLLLQLSGKHIGPTIEMPFDRILSAVAQGRVDAGVIIHEGRFTYESLGLHLLLDLGEWWESETGHPLPLGAIVMKRDLGFETAAAIEEKIRESLRFATANREDVWPYIRSHAQEMEPTVIRRHIDMFVNDFTMDVGSEGEEAIRYILELAAREEGKSITKKPLFRSEY